MKEWWLVLGNNQPNYIYDPEQLVQGSSCPHSKDASALPF